MNKHDKQSKFGEGLLKLNQNLLQLMSFKVDLLTRGEALTLEYSQDAAAQSRERRTGIPQTISESLRTQLRINLDQNDQELRDVNSRISSVEKKITFLQGEASGLTKAAKAGANGRKNKYAAMKKTALDWYLKERHRFQNKDDAAIEITKNHAVEFSTARRWLKGV